MIFPSLCDGKFPEELGLEIKKQYKMQEHGWVLTIGFIFLYYQKIWQCVVFKKGRTTLNNQLSKTRIL